MDIMIFDASLKGRSIRSVHLFGRSLPFPFTIHSVAMFLRFFGAKIRYGRKDGDTKSVLRRIKAMYAESGRFESMRIVPVGGSVKKHVAACVTYLRRYQVLQRCIIADCSSRYVWHDIGRLVARIGHRDPALSSGERLVTFVIVGSERFIDLVTWRLRWLVPKSGMYTRMDRFLGTSDIMMHIVRMPIRPSTGPSLSERLHKLLSHLLADIFFEPAIPMVVASVLTMMDGLGVVGSAFLRMSFFPFNGDKARCDRSTET